MSHVCFTETWWVDVAHYERVLIHDFWCQVAIAAMCKLMFLETAIQYFDEVQL